MHGAVPARSTLRRLRRRFRRCPQQLHRANDDYRDEDDWILHELLLEVVTGLRIESSRRREMLAEHGSDSPPAVDPAQPDLSAGHEAEEQDQPASSLGNLRLYTAVES